jgi:hypothetical protein
MSLSVDLSLYRRGRPPPAVIARAKARTRRQSESNARHVPTAGLGPCQLRRDLVFARAREARNGQARRQLDGCGTHPALPCRSDLAAAAYASRPLTSSQKSTRPFSLNRRSSRGRCSLVAGLEPITAVTIGSIGAKRRPFSVGVPPPGGRQPSPGRALLCQTPALASANESAFATELGDGVIEAGGELGGIERRAGLRLQPKRDLFTAGLDVHRRKLLVFLGRTGAAA